MGRVGCEVGRGSVEWTKKEGGRMLMQVGQCGLAKLELLHDQLQPAPFDLSFHSVRMAWCCKHRTRVMGVA